MKIIFLINPFSASYTDSTSSAVEEICRETGVEFEIEETSKTGLAGQAAKAFSNADGVICSGGDGTIHGTAEGFIKAGILDKKLGVIPAGTGNDLYRHLDGDSSYKKNIKAFLKRLLQGDTVLHSVWSVGNKHFVNYLSVGYDAVVSDSYRQKREASGTPSSRYGNYFRYFILGLKKMGYSLDDDVYIESAEGEIRAKKALIISNIRSYAGGAKVKWQDNDSLSCIRINSIFGYARFMGTRLLGSVPSVSISEGVLKSNKTGILQVDGENYPLSEMPEELPITKVLDIPFMVTT